MHRSFLPVSAHGRCLITMVYSVACEGSACSNSCYSGASADNVQVAVLRRGEPNSFKASLGWLGKFQARHGIRELVLHGESLSADKSSIDPFRQDILQLIEKEGLTNDHLFNADKTGLPWRGLPSCSLCHGGETQARNFKKSKERVTLMACANASGTCKVPLVFIHSSKNQRCFKHMDINSLPVSYYAQKNPWMDRDIFQ